MIKFKFLNFNLYKFNFFITKNFKMAPNEIEVSDFIEGQLTSSPSSTKSSSASSTCSTSSTNSGSILPVKSSIKTQKIHETPNSKVVSIHELISLKSPNSQYQVPAQNFVKINRTTTITNTESSLMITNDDDMNLDHHHHHQQQLEHEHQQKQQVWLAKSNKTITMNTGLTKRLTNNNDANNYDLLANANSSLPQKNM